MLKKLWRKIKKSVGEQSSKPKDVPELSGARPDVANAVKPTKPPVPPAASSNEMSASTSEAAKPVKWAGACPSYAAKSVVGQRMTMEDSWQAVPELVVIPKWWTCNARDHLPPFITPPAQASADPQPIEQPSETAADAAEAAARNLTNTEPNPAPTSRAEDATSQQPSSFRQPMDPKQQAALHGTEPVTVHFFAVYDGHGGPDVAKHCAKSLHEHLKVVVTANVKPGGLPTSGPLPAQLSDATPSAATTTEVGGSNAGTNAQPAEVWPARVDGIEAALKAAFLHTDAQLAKNRSAHEVGTTAVVSLVTARTLWVGNCGDSRALLCREHEAVALSLDHKATRTDEVTRVEQAGGYVWWDRVMGELAVSRAIGDHCLRPFVIAEPEITSVLRRPEDRLLIMASDGLWDVFTNEEARALALEKFKGELSRTSSSKMSVKKAASSLVKAALAKGSRDNVTVVVVDVRLHGYAAGRHAARSEAATSTAVATGSAGQSPETRMAEQSPADGPTDATASIGAQDTELPTPVSPVTPGALDAGD